MFVLLGGTIFRFRKVTRVSYSGKHGILLITLAACFFLLSQEPHSSSGENTHLVSSTYCVPFWSVAPRLFSYSVNSQSQVWLVIDLKFVVTSTPPTNPLYHNVLHLQPPPHLRPTPLSTLASIWTSVPDLLYPIPSVLFPDL